MSSITNDRQLRTELDSLPLARQRALGVLFAGNVKIGETEAPDLTKVLAAASKSPDDEQEREYAFRSAKSLATRTYAACGSDADWQIQAVHFIAAACAAALASQDQIPPGVNPAWKAAIQARMAKNCLMMENETGETDNEAQNQYRITEGIINP